MTTTATPSIPSWEWSELQNLGSAGDLSGVNPLAIGAIDQAESSGVGGGINSAGYGGFFGLGEDSTYPGGSPSPALLEATSTSAFDTQAEIAASAFNEYLTEAGGDPVAAEEIYQTGSASGPTEGSKILASLLGASSAGGSSASSSGSASATLTGLNLNPLDLFGIPQTVTGSVASSVWGEVGPFMVKAILVIAGLGIIGMGLYSATKTPREDAKADAQQTVQSVGPLAAAAA
jgi:hypothetical protein